MYRFVPHCIGYGIWTWLHRRSNFIIVAVTDDFGNLVPVDHNQYRVTLRKEI